MDLNRLEELKRVMTSAKDLSKIFYYFLDHFGEDEAFLELGKPGPHKELESLMSVTAGQMLKTTVIVMENLLIAVPGTQFIHGACRINGRPANVLYFEDIQVGLLVMLPVGKGPMLQSRFSARVLPPEAIASKN
jgi:hypothetical protein